MAKIYTFTSRKYPQKPHRRWQAFGPFPGEGCQLFVRQDTVMSYVGTRKRLIFSEPCWEIVWPDRGYKMAMWFLQDGSFGGIYADVCLPPEIDAEIGTVEFLDLDLDVQVRGSDGALSVRILDRQEFLRNRRALHYPGTLAAYAEAALARLLSDIARRRYPLDRPLRQWHEELIRRLEDVPPGVFSLPVSGKRD